MPEFDTDVIVVGAAPTGLMLATELGLAGLRPLVLERLPRVRETPKAGGLGGQILQLLRYRGLLERFGAAVGPAPGFPFGGLEVDLTPLADPPLPPPLQAESIETRASTAPELNRRLERGRRPTVGAERTRSRNARTEQVHGGQHT